jgi:hypothetical protein
MAEQNVIHVKSDMNHHHWVLPSVLHAILVIILDVRPLFHVLHAHLVIQFFCSYLHPHTSNSLWAADFSCHIGIGVGKYMNGYNATECSDCGRGLFQSDFNATSCDPCEVGEGNDALGQIACAACAAGTYTNITGNIFCMVIHNAIHFLSTILMMFLINCKCGRHVIMVNIEVQQERHPVNYVHWVVIHHHLAHFNVNHVVMVLQHLYWAYRIVLYVQVVLLMMLIELNVSVQRAPIKYLQLQLLMVIPGTSHHFTLPHTAVQHESHRADTNLK